MFFFSCANKKKYKNKNKKMDSLVSNLFRNILPSDIIKHVIIRFTFLKCQKCSKYMDWEEEKTAKNDWCPNCMFSICFRIYCDFVGTKDDFHQEGEFWFCPKHTKDDLEGESWVCRQHRLNPPKFCTLPCSEKLSDPHYLTIIKGRRKLSVEEREKKFEMKVMETLRMCEDLDVFLSKACQPDINQVKKITQKRKRED